MEFPVIVRERILLGSCADSRYGVGLIIRGKDYKVDSEGAMMECLDGEWIRVYSICILNPLNEATLSWEY